MNSAISLVLPAMDLNHLTVQAANKEPSLKKTILVSLHAVSISIHIMVSVNRVTLPAKLVVAQDLRHVKAVPTLLFLTTPHVYHPALSATLLTQIEYV